MGGVNHQPCGKPLPYSTEMSKRLSLAHARIELANVALEDALLADLAGRKTTVVPFINEIVSAHATLGDFETSIEDLRTSLKQEKYEMLETLVKMDTKSVGAKFVSRGMVRQDAWDQVAAIVKKDGFYGVLDRFTAGARDLKAKTTTLREKAGGLVKNKKAGGVACILEENRAENIRVEFAQLYTAWSNFHAQFLASALMCTESWYQHNKYPSL